MGRRYLCCSPEQTKKDPKKEINRLRLNWFFMMVIAALYAVSYTSVSSSFHQFITNPREEGINKSLSDTSQPEPGLGESESFYSWVITIFNVGAIIGSLMGGLLLKWVPYWHLVLSSLGLHTLGYILYAVATSGWLVMLSKLLSGVFIGAEMTLALAYFGESQQAYTAAVKQLGKKEGGAGRVKHTLFALHSVGVNVGYVFGPGVAVIFAQFSINQFRSIAWYNVAVGLAVIVTQLLIFRGESSCHKPTNCSWKSSKAKQKPKLASPKKSKLSRMTSISHVYVYDNVEEGSVSTERDYLGYRFLTTCQVLVFLIVGRAALGFRFCVYETLFNPILSDSFGLNERDASYFFFGLVAAQVCGTILLLVLQGLRLSSRLVAIIGLVMTITATLLMGDWQAIRRDPCIEASLFHHPYLIHTYTSQMNHVPPAPNDTRLVSDQLEPSIQCERLNLSLGLLVHLNSTVLDVQAYPNIAAGEVNSYGCEVVESCPYCSMDWNEVERTYSATPTCLHLHINPQKQCLEKTPLLSWKQEEPHPLSTSYLCTRPKSHFTYCLLAQPLSSEEESVAGVQELEEEKAYIADIHRQSIEIMEGRIDVLASQACRQHPDGPCHWNPSSSLTHRHCEDCPPICRHRSNYLEFSQFTIAAALLLISVPVARVPITSIISDIVTPDQQFFRAQGIVMGLAQALNAVARSVGPLWLDAAYEGTGKRTFLAMGLSLVCYCAILIGFLLVYPKLTPPPASQYSAVDSDSDSSGAEDCPALGQMESFSDSDFMP